MEVLLETLGDVIKKAFAGWSGKKVAAAEANFTSLQKLYAFAQCTPDLTAWDCNKCLQNANGYLVEGKQGGRTLTPSCIVMYESYPFYNASALPVSAPPPPPPAPVTDELTTVESLQFDLATIQVATNDFSSKNKLGEGGFGEVFQGRLLDGQQIAVKRLSRSSRQGDEEFKNEVLLVAKLQHRNLVRLLGFCLEGDEKLLVYEFVPNKSLDYFLFDPQKGGQLNWSLRYKIIYGIARGMLYLHEDSRLRIIHRDLKCSNILLDSEMNPKISDFGMARIFGVNQTQASTTKIMGTFGYMSPEYAMHGEFSVKSDVYSFGILLIEIICGKKNNFYHQLDGGEYLASYIWNKWRDGTPLKVLDPAIMDSYSRDEFLRCLHIGLLCIQEDPAIRPIMATVVHMLSSNYLNLSSPRRPAFFIRSRLGGLSIPMKELGSNQSTGRSMPLSTNDMSVTELYPR
ncbi:cysteine-rich receptor-like protein kinase 10 [Eucalyptus grandis]|uniref:cysteine-rich receptor-like protein kinase 10 n=1 Tax=Eucalyptus grandis TaxID=71139 RepID=UPI00192E843B|nr:cysteine-rich receptor-like protein kinase 10 [Eucalyptus grandis]